LSGKLNSTDFRRSNLILTFLIVVSIFGFFLSTFFAFHPSTQGSGFAYRKLVAGTAFTILCVSGILASLFPSSCSAIPKFKKQNKQEKSAAPLHKTTFQAHHPPCDNYSTHILIIGRMKLCATCSGLMVGATFVLFVAGLYFFGSYSLGDPFLLFPVGATGVALGLIQSALPKYSNGIVRFIASILFVVGTFLMLVGLDNAAKNISIDLFFVAISLLWILTKIALSERDHQRTCSNCTAESCPEGKKVR
jgi:small-conductance mechanosensitive channel